MIAIDEFPFDKYDAYHEIVDAHDPDIAAACGCLVGQSVARVYPKIGGGAPKEFIGLRDQAEAFVRAEMKKAKVK